MWSGDYTFENERQSSRPKNPAPSPNHLPSRMPPRLLLSSHKSSKHLRQRHNENHRGRNMTSPTFFPALLQESSELSQKMPIHETFDGELRLTSLVTWHYKVGMNTVPTPKLGVPPRAGPTPRASWQLDNHYCSMSTIILARQHQSITSHTAAKVPSVFEDNMVQKTHEQV